MRIFLKHLGYEKFATSLEEAKIGMLELPYVTEERLETLGIPMGPRLRILAECKTAAAIVGSAAATAGAAAGVDDGIVHCPTNRRRCRTGIRGRRVDQHADFVSIVDKVGPLIRS